MPLSKSVWVSQGVTFGAPFVVRRRPPWSVERRVRQRQLQAGRVDERLVEDAVVTGAGLGGARSEERGDRNCGEEHRCTTHSPLIGFRETKLD